MKRSIFRVTAAALAFLLPAGLATVAPASAGTPVDQLSTDNYVAPGKIVAKDADVYNEAANQEFVNSGWVKKLRAFQDLTRTVNYDANGNVIPAESDQEPAETKTFNAFDNVHVYTVYSPSMDREVPVAVIQPWDKEKRDNAPTQYLLNGADGGEGSANWIVQTDVVEYYGGNPFSDLYDKLPYGPKGTPATVGNGIGANIVIPMAGAFSYYSDWVNEEPALGGKQMWETFVTAELPQAIEPALNANGKRGIAGLSMSGTSTLNFAQHHPGRYDTIGSFSGCAATTSPLPASFIDITLNRGNTSMQTMWGGRDSETARYNDALLNAEKLRGQDNIYVSNGTGWAGPYDIPSARRVNGNFLTSGKVMVEGGAIEAATNTCTRDLRNRTEALGIPVHYNFRPQGTHQWGYWESDMRAYWPVMQAGLGTVGFDKPESDPYLDGAAGNPTGSLPTIPFAGALNN